MAGPQDAAELLDVDVDQLAGPLALVSVGRLERLQPGEPAEPDPGQDPLHGRERHAQALRDLLAGHPHTTQRRDRLDAIISGGVGPGPRRRGAVHQTQLALRPEAAHPLRGGALAHLGGLGRLGERPILLDYPPSEPQPLLRREGRVTVELHPVTSLGLGGLDTPSLQGGPDEQRGQVLQLDIVHLASGRRPVGTTQGGHALSVVFAIAGPAYKPSQAALVPFLARTPPSSPCERGGDDAAEPRLVDRLASRRRPLVATSTGAILTVPASALAASLVFRAGTHASSGRLPDPDTRPLPEVVEGF